MTWTRTPPAEPGWYWCREHPADTPFVIEVWRYPHGTKLCVNYPATDDDRALIDQRHPEREWAGPILSPGQDQAVAERARAAAIVRGFQPVMEGYYEPHDGRRVADVVDWPATREELAREIEGV